MLFRSLKRNTESNATALRSENVPEIPPRKNDSVDSGFPNFPLRRTILVFRRVSVLSLALAMTLAGLEDPGISERRDLE